MHRAWIKVREACSSDDVEAIIAEAKRGEESILDAYEDAIDRCSGSPICDLLCEQKKSVKQVLSRLEALCDAKSK